MDDAARVGIADRLAHLLEDSQKARQMIGGACAFLEQSGERTALDELHGKERPVAVDAQLVDGDQAGMLQLSADLRLLVEAPQDAGVTVMIVQQHLEGQVAAQHGVAAAQHGAHAASPDLAVNLEAAQPLRWHVDGVPGRRNIRLRATGTWRRAQENWRLKRGRGALRLVQGLVRPRDGLLRHGWFSASVGKTLVEFLPSSESGRKLSTYSPWESVSANRLRSGTILDELTNADDEAIRILINSAASDAKLKDALQKALELPSAQAKTFPELNEAEARVHASPRIRPGCGRT